MTDNEKKIMKYTISACLVCMTVLTAALTNCQPSSNPKTAKAETDFCKLRAEYVVITGGKLDAPDGSPRAQLETAEDKFCLAMKGDAGQ